MKHDGECTQTYVRAYLPCAYDDCLEIIVSSFVTLLSGLSHFDWCVGVGLTGGEIARKIGSIMHVPVCEGIILNQAFRIREGGTPKGRVALIDDVARYSNLRVAIGVLKGLACSIAGIVTIVERAPECVVRDFRSRYGLAPESLVRLQIPSYPPSKCPICIDPDKRKLNPPINLMERDQSVALLLERADGRRADNRMTHMLRILRQLSDSPGTRKQLKTMMENGELNNSLEQLYNAGHINKGLRRVVGGHTIIERRLKDQVGRPRNLVHITDRGKRFLSEYGYLLERMLTPDALE